MFVSIKEHIVHAAVGLENCLTTQLAPSNAINSTTATLRRPSKKSKIEQLLSITIGYIAKRAVIFWEPISAEIAAIAAPFLPSFCI
jgi:hypothetical protein